MTTEPRSTDARGNAARTPDGASQALCLPQRVQHLWLPLLLFALGSTFSYVMWNRAQRERGEGMSWLVDQVTVSLRNSIQAHVSEQFLTLNTLKSLYERFGDEGEEFWRERQALFLEDRPGTMASFLHLREQERAWAAFASGLSDDEKANLRVQMDIISLSWARHSEAGPWMAGPLARVSRLPDAERPGYLYAVGLELRRDGAASSSGAGAGADAQAPLIPGTFVTLIDADTMLKEVLDAHAFGFAAQVEWGGTVLYSRDAGEDKDEELWKNAREVPLRGGKTWNIRLAPLAEGEASPILRRTETATLWGGILVALLLAALAHETLLSRSHARVTVRVLEELRAEMRNTERAQSQLRMLNSELELRVDERTRALNDAIDDLKVFNYSVSHDLRSPLGAIASFAAILTEDYADKLDDDGRDYLHRIHRSAGNVLGMMDGLLNLSRLAHASPNFKAVELGPLARDVVREITAGAPRKVTIEIGALPRVRCDESMMRIVFTNLVNNAIKFTREADEPRVEIGSRPLDDGRVEIFVRDNGVGFDAKFAERLFRPFERLHAQSRYEGHGLGLAIVGRILRFHGTAGHATGTPGAGAEFSFAFTPMAGNQA